MRQVEVGKTKQETSSDPLPRPVFAEVTAWQELVMLAKTINPKLPDDLSGYVIRITMSKDQQTAEIVSAHR